MSRKGAIELSASFIVIIIISIVILAAGLTLFFKLKDNTQSYVDKLDSQTQDRLKSVMLSNNYKTAVYPTDLKIDNGDAELIGIGITSTYDVPKSFSVEVIKIKRYATPTAIAQDIAVSDDYRIIDTSTFTINPRDQVTKGVLLKMDPDSDNGQYVYTINISVDGSTYGLQQVYVDNP